ncbi:MAG: tetratricopeptide repeat protein, partial [Pseudomonadota bacterium]
AESRGDTKQAIMLFEQILQDFPRNAEIYFIMYRIRMEQGRQDDADALIDAGIELTGGDVRLRMQRAAIAEREGDFDAAIEQYEAVFAAEPDSMIAANNLASTLSEHRADDPEQLARAKKIALRLKGTDVPQMKDTVGWTLYLAGDYNEALIYLLDAVKVLPNSALVNYHTGMTFVALGDMVQGRTYLERALELAEGTAFPHFDTAQATLADLPAETAVE